MNLVEINTLSSAQTIDKCTDVDSLRNGTWVTCGLTEWTHRSWSLCSTDQSSLVLHKTQLHHVTVCFMHYWRNYVNWQRAVHDLSHPGTAFNHTGITRSRFFQHVVTSSMTVTQVQIADIHSSWLQDHHLMKGPSSVQQPTFATATPHIMQPFITHICNIWLPPRDANHCRTPPTIAHSTLKRWKWVLVHITYRVHITYMRQALDLSTHSHLTT